MTNDKKDNEEPVKAKEHDEALEILYKRVDSLQTLIIKMAHYNGTSALLKEFDLEPFVPQKNDMTKFKK